MSSFAESNDCCQCCLGVLTFLGSHKQLEQTHVCTHPFSGSLDLLTVAVQVGKDLLTHLFCKKNSWCVKRSMSDIYKMKSILGTDHNIHEWKTSLLVHSQVKRHEEYLLTNWFFFSFWTSHVLRV